MNFNTTTEPNINNYSSNTKLNTRLNSDFPSRNIRHNNINNNLNNLKTPINSNSPYLITFDNEKEIERLEKKELK